MKIHAIAIFALTTLFMSCSRQDIPVVSVDQEEYLVDSNGGEITIPVFSTGIDDVSFKLGYSDKWNTDPDNGDLTPVTPWISVSKVIENYPQTRALLSWTSGVVLNIEQNKTTSKREAIVLISSFSKTANVKVVQAGLPEQ
ncbi:MAG: BACON domain-containing protein [Bacteroidales bacterium]|nr:BACON domain-containing protein [Bacteroidales bacterium]